MDPSLEELRNDLQELVKAYNQCVIRLALRISNLEVFVKGQAATIAALQANAAPIDGREGDLFYSRKPGVVSGSISIT